MANLLRCTHCIVVMLLIVLLPGCVTTHFTEPITSFQESINTSGAAIGSYYAELNQFEREIYLESVMHFASSASQLV